MSKAARQRTARERLAEERRRHAEQQKRIRAVLITLSAVAMIVAVVFTVVFVQSRKADPSGYQGPLAPFSRESDGSIVMAKAEVTGPVLEVFEDFQCPACKNFEESNGDTLKRLAAEGKVKVVYRPFRLFQQEPLKSNSQRAANAAGCAPADKWVSFHDIVFEHQPREGAKGFDNKDLIQWGKEAGIGDAAFEKCVMDGERNSLVDQTTQYARTAGVEGTPTLKLDGTKLGDQATYTKEGLEQAVMAASASRSSTPSPTPDKNDK